MGECAPFNTPADRRTKSRPQTFINSHGYHVAALDVWQASLHRNEWKLLASRTIEPNVFCDPDFALAAARNAVGARPAFVMVRRLVEGRMRLVGVFPFCRSDLRGWRRTVRSWRSPYAPLGTPLLDRQWYKGAFDAVLHWLAWNRRSGVLFSDVRIAGAFGSMATRRAARLGSRVSAFDVVDRPALPASATEQTLSPNLRRNLRRCRTRLERLGPVSFQFIRDIDSVKDAFELFLVMEASGWKGRRGTALMSEPAVRRFSRTAVGALAQDGACQIGALSSCGRPIAMVVLFGQADGRLCWKSAYDETFARFSPGLLLMAFLTEALLSEESFRIADSCAMPDNGMVARLWRRRIRIGDLLVETAPHIPGFAATKIRESLRRAARRATKTALGHSLPAWTRSSSWRPGGTG